MINATTILRTLVNLDRQSAYIPVLSTVTSLTHLFLKYAVIPSLDVNSQHWVLDNYFTYVAHSNTRRQVELLLPLIGNLKVYFDDKKRAQQGDLLYEKAAKLTFESWPITKPKHLEQATKFNHVEAMAVLGTYLYVNIFEEPYEYNYSENAKGFVLLKRATYLGSMEAALGLGYSQLTCEEMGMSGLEKEMSGSTFKAFEIFKRAAELGDREATDWLQYCYREGYGTPKDEKMATKINNIMECIPKDQKITHFY